MTLGPIAHAAITWVGEDRAPWTLPVSALLGAAAVTLLVVLVRPSRGLRVLQAILAAAGVGAVGMLAEARTLAAVWILVVLLAALTGLRGGSRRSVAARAARQATDDWVLRAAVEDAAGPMAVTDLRGRFQWMNQAMCDFLGRSRQELRGMAWAKYVFPSDVQSQARKVEQLITGEIWSFKSECRFRHREGTVAWGLVGMSLVNDPSGEPAYLFVAVADMNERVGREGRAREREAHYRSMFDVAPMAMWELDLSGAARMLAKWKKEGVVDLETLFTAEPERVLEVVGAAVVRHTNESARSIFEVEDGAEFSRQVASGVLGPGYVSLMAAALVEIWKGSLRHAQHAVLTAADGRSISGTISMLIPKSGGNPDFTAAVVGFTGVQGASAIRAA